MCENDWNTNFRNDWEMPDCLYCEDQNMAFTEQEPDEVGIYAPSYLFCPHCDERIEIDYLLGILDNKDIIMEVLK